MKSLGLVGVYVAALGALVAGNTSDVWDDSLDGPLLLLAIFIGLGVFTLSALKRSDK